MDPNPRSNRSLVPRSFDLPTLIGGLVLLGLGCALLAERLDLVRWRDIGAWWPVILIGFGISRLVSGRLADEGYGGSTDAAPSAPEASAPSASSVGADPAAALRSDKRQRDAEAARRSGAVLVVVGCWQLINTLELWGFHWSNSWPLMPLFLGLLWLAWPFGDEDRGAGAVMAGVGLWLLCNTRDLFGLTWSNSWPLLLVFVGLSMVVRAIVQAMPRRNAKRIGSSAKGAR
jgi:hypothetical protein